MDNKSMDNKSTTANKQEYERSAKPVMQGMNPAIIPG